MTIDEAIKHCEDAAEKDKEIAEFCNNTEPYSEFFEKESEKYFQIADWLKVLKDIIDVGSCNECKSRGVCKYEPEAGQMVRYNCPFYTDDIYSELKRRHKKENEMTYGDIYYEFCKKFPNVEVKDYRPATSMFVPELGEGIPYGIVVWLKDGSKMIYIAKEVKDE